MNTKIWLSVIVAVILVWVGYDLLMPHSATNTSSNSVFDPLNATYSIEGQSVTLVNGSTQTQAAPGSATTITTTVFGQPVSGDVNADGIPDGAIILVQNPGGSGTFYYIASAINKDSVAQGTNALLLGDRIAPQNVQIENGKIIANYADRKAGEPMTTPPSVGVSKYFIYDGSLLKEDSSVSGAGGHCGGNMTTAPTCIAGYHCAPVPGSHLPFGDVGGICVAN